MRFGTILLWSPGEREGFEARVRLAEELGFDVVGVGDSPNAYRDWSVGAGLAALATERVLIGSTVTSPHGRHPVGTANALSTLQELSGGRMFCGVGTGGSAAAATGGRTAKQDELRAYVEAVRALLAGEPATWDGSAVPPMTGAAPVPLIISAYGPASMRLAGTLADGVILAVGASPELVVQFRREVAEGAEAAGRSPDDVEVWVMARIAVGDDRQAAIDDVKANLASAGAFGLRSEAQMSSVPDLHKDAVLELQRRYDPTKHVTVGGPNAQLVDELGLADYLAERFGIVGTPDECRTQVEALREAGVAGVLAPAVDRDPDGLLRRIAATVITSPA